MKTAIHDMRRNGRPFRHHQRGVTLMVALLVLVAMTLAGLALVRSVDSATLMAGNLAFRQSAAASADKGMEVAIAALKAMAEADREKDRAAYYAKLPKADIDFTTSLTPYSSADDFNWKSSAADAGTDTAGNAARYVIHRLCSDANTGPLDMATCSTSAEESTLSSSVGGLVPNETYRDPTITGTGAVMRGYYRITVRVAGPRNTFSYVQTIVML